MHEKRERTEEESPWTAWIRAVSRPVECRTQRWRVRGSGVGGERRRGRAERRWRQRARRARHRPWPPRPRDAGAARTGGRPGQRDARGAAGSRGEGSTSAWCHWTRAESTASVSGENLCRVGSFFVVSAARGCRLPLSLGDGARRTSQGVASPCGRRSCAGRHVCVPECPSKLWKIKHLQRKRGATHYRGQTGAAAKRRQSRAGRRPRAAPAVRRVRIDEGSRRPAPRQLPAASCSRACRRRTSTASSARARCASTRAGPQPTRGSRSATRCACRRCAWPTRAERRRRRRANSRSCYEDEHLIAIDKPAGVAVHGGSGVSFGVIEQLRQARPQARFLELVHRLDKETSGLLLLAKKRSGADRAAGPVPQPRDRQDLRGAGRRRLAGEPEGDRRGAAQVPRPATASAACAPSTADDDDGRRSITLVQGGARASPASRCST